LTCGLDELSRATSPKLDATAITFAEYSNGVRLRACSHSLKESGTF
jgi:hypothetical protein